MIKEFVRYNNYKFYVMIESEFNFLYPINC